jgi:hypothetical protein
MYRYFNFYDQTSSSAPYKNGEELGGGTLAFLSLTEQDYCSQKGVRKGFVRLVAIVTYHYYYYALDYRYIEVLI